MYRAFPQVAQCSMPVALLTKDIVMRNVLCVLFKNVLYQHIFLVLWFYLAILGVITVLQNVFMIFELICWPFRTWWVILLIQQTNACCFWNFMLSSWNFRCLKRKLAPHFDEDELLKLITDGRSYSEWLLLTKLSKVRLKHEFCIELEIDEMVPLFSLCRQCTMITLSWWWKKLQLF